MGLFSALMTSYRQSHEGKNPPLLKMAALSIFSGGTGAFMSNPADLAMVRFQNDGLLPKDQQRNYKNFFDAASRMAKEEGVQSLWKGAVANIMRSAALTAGQLCTNAWITEKL